MGGKASLLVVLGFSMIFLVVGLNFSNLSTRAVDNYSSYYTVTKAYDIAVSGANMAANQIFMDKTWDAGYQNLSFDGGVLNVYVSNTITGTAGKVLICHTPPGNPNAKHSMWVPVSAVPSHLAHGDYLGDCSGQSSGGQTATIISEGTYNGVTKVVEVLLRGSSFAKFGNYYSTMSAYPATGDTFEGPFHVNEWLTTYGSPVFWGKATSAKGLKMMGSPKDPKFYGGYEDGVNIPLEFDTTNLRSNADYIFYDTTRTKSLVNVRLYFNSDGTLTYSQKIGAGNWSSSKTVNLSTFAPNGVIYVQGGNIYTKGTLNGKVTIVAAKSKITNAGNVYFEDNLVYNKDPRIYPNSTDMLGIVAEQNIRIQDNPNTRGKDIYTQASMYAQNGTIGPEDGLINQNFLGQWNILGGLIASNTRATAQYDYKGNPIRGLKFVHRYDNRFLTSVPPSFPNTKSYEVVSWLE
ncbi:hypothetical protein ABRY23_13445 [Melioribacteraceae bacterium 4301-Me]|uniref:hypothetical protein n=1 Tax=Pyranulibacter aquaticus TaxID=3163344 RepID=UPI00359A7DC1